MKRNAEQEAPPGASPRKKAHISHTQHAPTSSSSSTSATASLHTPSQSYYQPLEDPEDDMTTTTTGTPNSAHIDPESPPTAATTPRTKFPSDLKTLACTWPNCTKTFNRPARLRDHLNSHTNSRPFTCPYPDCHKDYTVDKHLKQHIKAVHTNERNHVCQRPGCGKSFVTGTRLKRHQAVHEGADRFRCQDCGQSFRKKDTLSKHVRKEHQGLAAFACSETECIAAFDTKASLRRHWDREHGEARFWCGECPIVRHSDGSETRPGFTTEMLLQAHIKQEHQNCMFCDFKSTRQGDLERHIEFHHSGKSVHDRKTEPCPYPDCGRFFTSRSNRNNHVRTAHEGFRFVCGFDAPTPGSVGLETWTNDQGCGDTFCTKVRLEDHIRYVHLRQERPPKISAAPPLDRDNDGYENYDNLCLIDDIAGLITQDKTNIPCPHCDEMFIRYADVHAHVEHAHAHTYDAHHDNEQVIFGGVSWEEEDIQQQQQEEEELFSAEMDHGPVDDDWAEDEANILLLARDSPPVGLLDKEAIDPALHGF